MTRTFLILAVAAILALPASAQVHKDTRLGFQFKPPKDFNAIALKPTDITTVAKYQSDQRAHGSSWGAQSNPSFQLRFYPLGEDDDLETVMERRWESAEEAFGYSEIAKEKKVKIAKVSCLEKHIRPENGAETIYYAVVPQDDGIFVFQGRSITERFDKYVKDFSKAAKSLKRIKKEDTSERQAELDQMSDQEAYLQRQIDKLPPGWDFIRTKRYLFLFNAEKNWVKDLSKQIEKIRDTYEKLYPPDEPITAVSIVRVCASRDEYIGYGGSAGSGGYWSSFHKELVVFDSPPRNATEATLNHEAFHQYIYYFYGELAPHSWYNEGTGDYFAGAKMSKTYRIQGFGDAPGGIARQATAKEACRLLAEGKTDEPRCGTPLKDLMRFTQREYYNNGLVHYAQGWAVVHMLREAKRLEPKWDRILDDYLVNLVEARHEVAIKTRDRALEQAEKKEPGSSAELDQDPEDWYAKADTDEIQSVGYEKTFREWSQADWDAFNQAYLDYVEKL
jgi:hypothetical protein